MLCYNCGWADFLKLRRNMFYISKNICNKPNSKCVSTLLQWVMQYLMFFKKQGRDTFCLYAYMLHVFLKQKDNSKNKEVSPSAKRLCEWNINLYYADKRWSG